MRELGSFDVLFAQLAPDSHLLIGSFWKAGIFARPDLSTQPS
jgi:hypothetical protein